MSIFCIGRNYVAHAQELGNEVPTSPVIFMKPSASLLADGKNFNIPSFTNDLHYEGELVLRVSKQGKNLKAVNVIDYCDAITVGIDFTARDLQAKLKESGNIYELNEAFNEYSWQAFVAIFWPTDKKGNPKPKQYNQPNNNNRPDGGATFTGFEYTGPATVGENTFEKSHNQQIRKIIPSGK